MIVPQPDGSHPLHWVQDVRVVRDDQIAHWIKDFGPASAFAHVTPLFMPSMGENTVGQLQEHFDKNREDDYWFRRTKELEASSTLIEDALRFMEVRRLNILNRSVTGPAITVQRNAMPRQETLRNYKERRDERRGYSTF